MIIPYCKAMRKG